MILFQLAVCPKRVCISTVGVRKDLFRRDPHKVLITDFFGSLRPVELTVSGLNVTALSRTQHQTCRWDNRGNAIVTCFLGLCCVVVIHRWSCMSKHHVICVGSSWQQNSVKSSQDVSCISWFRSANILETNSINCWNVRWCPKRFYWNIMCMCVCSCTLCIWNSILGTGECDQDLKHTIILPVGCTSCKYYAYPHLSICCGGVNV